MDTLHFEQVIVTPSGTPLGGRVGVDVHDNGDYHVRFEMHSSSLLAPFDFNVRAYLTAPGFPTLAFVRIGHVDALDSAVHEEDGHSPLLALYWTKLKAEPHFAAVKDYRWSGAIGTLADIVNDIVEVFAGAAGFALGVVIGATKDALGLIGATLGPGATIGVIAGAVVFAIALGGVGIGGALIAGAITAVAVCVIADLLIDSRPMNEAEKTLARQVFGDTVPLDQIMLTNLGGGSGRGFTAQGVDGKIYINLGKTFDNPLGPGGGTYPYPGQILIHELTHAWQITHNAFLPGLMCSMLVTQADNSLGDKVYAYGPPGPDWSDLNPEQQGAIVDQWFGGNGNSVSYQPMDQQNIYYRYVWENVLQHASSPTAPANLRASTSSPLAAFAGREATPPDLPEEVDVFWTAADGSLVRQRFVDVADQGWGSHVPVAFAPASIAAGGSALAAVTRMPSGADVFCIGPDAAVADQGSSAGPAPVKIAPAAAARAGSAIAAVARRPGQLDVFWIGPDGAIITQWWNSDPTGDWGTHGPFAVTAPGVAQPGSGLAAVARVPQHLDVFWVGNDGAIWTMWADDFAPGGKWADHQPFPITSPGAARFASPVSAAARNPEQLDVFWIAPDGSVTTQWWGAGAGRGWADHQPFPVTQAGIARPGSGLAVTARTQLHLDVFWTGPDGAIMTQWWDAAPHMSWADHGAFPITPAAAAHTDSPVSAVSRDASHIDVFWVGPDGTVTVMWWGDRAGGNWNEHAPIHISPAGAVSHDVAAAIATASGLMAESARDAAAGKAAEAVDAISLAVSILESADVTPDRQLEYLIMLAEARHNLIARLIDNHQAAQAAALEPAAVAAYKSYAQTAGADVLRVGRDLAQLAVQLANAAQPAAAVDAQQDLVDVLAAAPAPAAGDRLEYLIMLAEARHNLIARLIDNHQAAQAAALAAPAIAAYQAYAATPGADLGRTGRDLVQLAAQLRAIGDTADAATAQQAADDLAAPH
jgi:hypothetical protein